jgi:PAS domain S-box-containing protein
MKNNYEIVQELKEEEKHGRLFSSSKESSKNNTSDQNLEHTCFKKFFENAPLYEYMVSPEGTILEINKTALTNLGYKKEELLGKNLTTIYAPESHEKMKILFSKWKETGEIDNEEMVIETKQGEKRRVLLSASAVRGADGAILYSISILKDVTEINKMYDELNKNLWSQNVKLQKLNETKKTFLKTTSHELRTPITSIKGYVQMLMKKTLGEINEGQMKGLEVILRNTNRLDQIIQNILDASSLESGSMKFIPRKVNPRALVEEITKTMEPFANKKEMTINVNLEKDLPDLMIDGERIKQVLLNLVDNAIKFSPDGSTINIKTRKEKEDVLFEVQDFGQGIPKDKQGMIFDAFYQADSGDDRLFGGVGLSLALSKGIVGLHGGNIWFESTEGIGSTFLFTLPIQSISDMDNTDLKEEMPSENTSAESVGLAVNSVTTDTTDEDASGSITEHEKITATPKENEERYQALFNSSFELVYLHDLKGNFIDANPTALKLLGYSKEELGSLNFSSILDGGQIWKAMKALNEIKKYGHQKESTEYRLKTKNGTIIDIETTAEKVYRDGKPYAIQGIAHNITEQKQAKQILKESEEKFRRLFDSSPDLIIETDEKGNILAMNPMMVKSIGVPADKLIGKNIFDILPREIAEERAKIARTALKEMKNQEYEDERAGRYFQNIYVPIIHPGGKRTIQLIARDITVQKIAEEEIRYLKDYNENILESNPNPILIVKGKHIEYVNKSFISAFGETKNEYITRNLKDVVPSEIFAVFENLLQVDGRSKELKFRGKDFNVRSFVVKKTVAEEEGSQGIVFQDITERKKAEEEIKRLAKFPAENPNPVLRIKKDGEVVYSNKAGFQILDFWKTNIGEDVPERWRNIIRKKFVSKNLKAEEEEEEINDKIFSFVVSPVADEGYVNLYGRDITERKKAEGALIESQEKYRLITENTNDLIIITNIDKTFRYVSPSIKSLGYTPDELVGQDSFFVLHPEDKISITSMLKQLVIGMYKPGTSSRFEYHLRDKSGVYHIYDTAAKLVKDASGKHVILSISRDITERKKAEEKIKIFSDAIASAFDCFMLTDVKGNITYANESAISAFGYTSEEFLKLNIAELDADPMVAKKVMQDIAVKERWSGDVINIRKNKEKFPAILSAFIIKDDKGNPIGTMGILRDITERKQAEEALRVKDWVIESAINAIAISDLQGNLNYVNPAFLKLWGYSSSAEILRKSATEFWQMGEKAAEVIDALRTRGGWIGELVAHRKNGALFEVQVSASMTVDAAGKPVCMEASFADITERKRMEERLHETEERFRIAAETSNDAVYEWDLQHSVQWFGKIDEMLGYGPGEFPRTFDAWTDLIHPEDKKRVAAAVQAYLDERMPYAIEYRVRTKDGTCRWWTARGAVARTPDGHPIRWIGTVTDITERKKAEKEVIESAEKLRRILDSSPDAITVTDLNGNIIECNQATSMLHGFNKKELIGKNALELFSPKDLERAKESLKETLESESVKNLEYTLLTKDGQEFPAELSACLIRDASGNPLSFVAITKDITERKRSEEALLDSEERHRVLFESSRDAIMTLEPPTWNFTTGNPATLEMFKVKNEEEFTSKGPENLSPERQPDGRSSAEKAKEMIETAMRNGSKFFEWTHKRINGEDFFATVLLSRVVQGGKVFLQATVRDITMQKQLEKKLKEEIDALELYKKLTVNRELKMIELKKRIAELEEKLKGEM